MIGIVPQVVSLILANYSVSGDAENLKSDLGSIEIQSFRGLSKIDGSEMCIMGLVAEPGVSARSAFRVLPLTQSSNVILYGTEIENDKPVKYDHFFTASSLLPGWPGDSMLIEFRTDQSYSLQIFSFGKNQKIVQWNASCEFPSCDCKVD
jgi:hypothetical protein